MGPSSHRCGCASVATTTPTRPLAVCAERRLPGKLAGKADGLQINPSLRRMRASLTRGQDERILAAWGGRIFSLEGGAQPPTRRRRELPANRVQPDPPGRSPPPALRAERRQHPLAPRRWISAGAAVSERLGSMTMRQRFGSGGDRGGLHRGVP